MGKWIRTEDCIVSRYLDTISWSIKTLMSYWSKLILTLISHCVARCSLCWCPPCLIMRFGEFGNNHLALRLILYSLHLKMQRHSIEPSMLKYRLRINSSSCLMIDTMANKLKNCSKIQRVNRWITVVEIMDEESGEEESSDEEGQDDE